MISDDERREAAAKLRALDIHDWYDFADEIYSLESAIGCNVGQRFESQSWRHRFADLIDRPKTRNLSEKPEFVCELCGAVWPYDLGFTHCPECGAEVVDDD